MSKSAHYDNSVLLMIDEARARNPLRHQTALWLKSDYTANVWVCDFRPDKGRFEIDFRKNLEDGTCLSDPKNRELLNFFKSWLCAHSSLLATNKQVLQVDRLERRSRQVLVLIDYFMSQAKYFRLSTHGLSLVTASDIRRALDRFSKSTTSSEKFYDWRNALLKFLYIHALQGMPLTDTTEQMPEKNTLNLSHANLAISAEWLKSNGYFWHSGSLKRKKLVSAILPFSLAGHILHFPTYELSMAVRDTNRAHKKIPSRTENNKVASKIQMAEIVLALKSMLLVNGPAAPNPDSLTWMHQVNIHKAHELSKIGRFKTIPFEILRMSLSSAIDLFINSGLTTLQRIVAVISESRLQAISPQEFLEGDSQPTVCQGSELQMWSVVGRRAGGSETTKEDIIQRPGLWDQYMILVGAIQIAIGALTARRISELLLLETHTCLDAARKNLLFKNRKSGIMGVRQTEARPIPDIIVAMVDSLISFQSQLTALGVRTSGDFLFSQLSYKGDCFERVSFSRYAKANDIFSDHLDIDVDTHERRHYIRQHSLRRFFAMCFYWGDAAGGLDTLRWFLGHSDPAYIYNYITESIPGEILRSVQVEYLLNAITERKAETEEVRTNMLDYFQCQSISFIGEDELEDYLTMIIAQKHLLIEPMFYTDAGGTKYEICIRIARYNG